MLVLIGFVKINRSHSLILCNIIMKPHVNKLTSPITNNICVYMNKYYEMYTNLCSNNRLWLLESLDKHSDS